VDRDIYSTHAVEFKLKFIHSYHSIKVVANVVNYTPTGSISAGVNHFKGVSVFKDLQLGDPEWCSNSHMDILLRMEH